MQIRSTVQPGHRGAKKLLSQYGERLVCVRYRYDAQGQRRLKTVELIVEEETWEPARPQLRDDILVAVRLTPAEVSLRKQVKQRGGRWNPQHGVWEVQYRHAAALGLVARIVDSGRL